MKKLIGILVIVTLIATLLMTIPAAAEDEGFIKLNTHFSVSPSGTGYHIPEGSTVYQNKDGTTTVYGPKENLLLKTRNAETSQVSTPNGKTEASRVFEVPDKSLIKVINDKKVQVYSNGKLILTTINENQDFTTPSVGDWLEQGRTDLDHAISADYSVAFWHVPYSPPDPNPDTIDYIFNALEPYSSLNAILQPVLEWNKWIENAWTITAWFGYAGIYYPSDSHPRTYPGYEICGEIGYDQYSFPLYYWLIQAADFSGDSSSLKYGGTNINPNSTSAFWVLELTGLEDYEDYTDDDVCGDITFYDIYLSRNGSQTNIAQYEDEYISDKFPNVSSLDVDWLSSSSVKLYTAN